MSIRNVRLLTALKYAVRLRMPEMPMCHCCRMCGLPLLASRQKRQTSGPWLHQQQKRNFRLDLASRWNHYKTLGVDQNATDKDIKKAYIKLCQLYHPDKNSNSTKGSKGHQKFVEVQNAYDTLRSPSKRAQYDQTLGGGRYTSPRESPFVYRRHNTSQQQNYRGRQRHQYRTRQEFYEDFDRRWREETNRRYQNSNARQQADNAYSSRERRDPLSEYWKQFYENLHATQQTSQRLQFFKTRDDLRLAMAIFIFCGMVVYSRVESVREYNERLRLRERFAAEQEKRKNEKNKVRSTANQKSSLSAEPEKPVLAPADLNIPKLPLVQDLSDLIPKPNLDFNKLNLSLAAITDLNSEASGLDDSKPESADSGDCKSGLADLSKSDSAPVVADELKSIHTNLTENYSVPADLIHFDVLPLEVVKTDEGPADFIEPHLRPAGLDKVNGLLDELYELNSLPDAGIIDPDSVTTDFDIFDLAPDPNLNNPTSQSPDFSDTEPAHLDI